MRPDLDREPSPHECCGITCHGSSVLIVGGAGKMKIQKRELEDQKRHSAVHLRTHVQHSKGDWEAELIGRCIGSCCHIGRCIGSCCQCEASTSESAQTSEGCPEADVGQRDQQLSWIQIRRKPEQVGTH